MSLRLLIGQVGLLPLTPPGKPMMQGMLYQPTDEHNEVQEFQITSYMLVFQGYHSKVPQTSWLKTTGINLSPHSYGG